jgi:hypothetical protein
MGLFERIGRRYAQARVGGKLGRLRAAWYALRPPAGEPYKIYEIEYGVPVVTLYPGWAGGPDSTASRPADGDANREEPRS